MMAETFRVKIDGLKDGVVKDQVVYQLVILFKRSQSDVLRIIENKGTVVKRGLELPTAVKYKFAVEQCGCVCAIEPEQEPVPQQSAESDFTAYSDPEPLVAEEPAVQPAMGLSLQEMDKPVEEISAGIESKPVEKKEAAVKPATPRKKEITEKSAATLSNEIGINVHDDPFIVYTPQTFCCNCGNENDVSGIETYFYKHLVFSTRFEKDKAIALTLPYCPTCAETAGKYPMSAPLKWLIAFGVWFGGFFLMMAMAGVSQKSLILRLLLLIVPVIPAVIAFRWIGHAKAPKTSACTPVIIKEFSRNPNSVRNEGRAMVLVSMIAAIIGFFFKHLNDQDPDKIKKFTIKFSNRAYGKEFKKKNKNSIQEGLIKVL